MFIELINWTGLHLSHIWTIQVLSLNVKVYVKFILFLQISFFICWQLCTLALYLHVFCFQSEGEVKSLSTGVGGKELKNFRTGAVTFFFFWLRMGEVSTHYIPCNFSDNGRYDSYYEVIQEMIQNDEKASVKWCEDQTVLIDVDGLCLDFALLCLLRLLKSKTENSVIFLTFHSFCYFPAIYIVHVPPLARFCTSPISDWSAFFRF